MTIELAPLGKACNLSCTYCYQEPERLAQGNMPHKYDIDKMLAEVDKVGQSFHLFGGEALLVPKRDLEKFWKHGYEKYGTNGMQTNGTLIDDDHIELFKKYNVHVGISIDGPNELNDLRKVRGKADNDDATYEATQKTMNNILKLARIGRPPGIIITIHRQNASKENLPRLLNFMRWLGDIGVSHGTLHTLEIESTMPDQEKYVLTQEEKAEVFLTIGRFLTENPDLDWNPFAEFPRILDGDDGNTTCFLNFCDPLDTDAVYGIAGDGALTNCGRTNKEGIDWYKADRHDYSRYISLYHTPEEMGGCHGCRFWMVCSGSCPGEAQDGDFRNKTTNCATMKAMLTFSEGRLEAEGKTPITKSYKREAIERIMLNVMSRGNRTNIQLANQEIDKVLRTQVQLPVGSPEGKNDAKDPNACGCGCGGCGEGN